MSEPAPEIFFSVIVTTYNRAAVLPRALDSLISQTEKDWEAIVVDDGSYDDTDAIITPYRKSFSSIRYMRQSHTGEAISKNTGIMSSAGRFITFLDSDDEYDPVHLESRKSVLLKNPFLKFIYGGVKIIGNQYVPDRFVQSRKIHLKDCVIGGTFFIERNTAVSTGGLKNILLGTDADLFDRLRNSGIAMMEVTYPTYIYHHDSEDSITNMMLNALK